ncbi:hypothetical protein SCALM49S_06181 [Streptomyces californicus]
MPAPVMWDAAVDQASGEHTNRARVDMKVVDKGPGEIDLVVTPDPGFLADPETTYPVTVDPSTSALSNTFDTYVQQGETVDWSSDTELDFGNPGRRTRRHAAHRALLHHVEHHADPGRADHRHQPGVVELPLG